MMVVKSNCNIYRTFFSSPRKMIHSSVNMQTWSSENNVHHDIIFLSSPLSFFLSVVVICLLGTCEIHSTHVHARRVLCRQRPRLFIDFSLLWQHTVWQLRSQLSSASPPLLSRLTKKAGKTVISPNAISCSHLPPQHRPIELTAPLLPCSRARDHTSATALFHVLVFVLPFTFSSTFLYILVSCLVLFFFFPSYLSSSTNQVFLPASYCFKIFS